MKTGPNSTAKVGPMMYAWDVFISHATDDKESVALPLAKKLEEAGLRPWIDSTAIDAGDNLRGKVNDGIARSRFGVVILTPRFLEKKWTVDELDALMALERPGHDVVVPVLHELTRDSLRGRYPLLANRVCLDTSVGLDGVVAAIIRVVLKKGADSPSQSFPTVRRRFLDLLAGASGPEVVRRFLQHHVDIIQRAAGASSKPTVAWVPTLGGVTPDVCVSSFLPTLGRREWHVIVLGPVGSRLFLDGTEPEGSLKKAVDDLDALRVWVAGHYPEARAMLSDITAEFTGVIVAGRRAELGPEQRERLERYNDLLFGARIRTYDWLVEASS